MRTVFATLLAIFFIALPLGALAIEPPDDVISKLGKMDSYATVKNGEVVFGDEKAFIWSSDWKIILGAYKKSP